MTTDKNSKSDFFLRSTKDEKEEVKEGTLNHKKVLQLPKVNKSTNHQTKINGKVYSFLKEEDERSSKSVNNSKSKALLIFNHETNKEIALTISDSSLDKKELASYITEEIFSYMGKLGKFGDTINEPPNMMDLCRRTGKRNKKVGRNVKRRLVSIVKELELPITLPKSKPNVDGRPHFERLLLDTHVTTSSTILAETDMRSKTTSFTSEPVHDSVSSRTKEEPRPLSSPFDLCWCFGFNAGVPVINLSNDDCSQILFANSQYAVIYDFREDSMKFLQGNINPVSCMAANSTGSLLVTADIRSDVGSSRVIVWDRRPCVVQVLEDPHPHGCQQVGISANGEFLVTVSANETPSTIKVWQIENDIPVASIKNQELGQVKKLTIRPNSKNEFLVTFERSVILARLTWYTVFIETLFECSVGENIKNCEFSFGTLTPPKLGSLTDSTFLEDPESIALSSTCKGYVVVWDGKVNTKHKKIPYKKYVRLHLDCITNIQLVDNKIAVATVSGNISFYDLDLKILYFHKLQQEPLVSLSFNLTDKKKHVTTSQDHLGCANSLNRETRKLIDASLKSKPFSVRHFIISTESGRIAYVNGLSGMTEFLPIPGQETFTALEMQANSNLLCVGTAHGKCLLIDTDSRKVKVTQQLKVQANLCQAVSVLKYSHSGRTLACGMYTGDIWLLDPIILTPILNYPLEDCTCCITHIKFTPESDYLLVVDVSSCVSVYFLDVKPTLIGQYIGHYKSIVSLVIEPYILNDQEIMVITVSEDRTVCVFLINKENQTFQFIVNQRVEQFAIPKYSINYPCPITAEKAYLGVNNECKFRIHDDPQVKSALHHLSPAKRSRGTFLAPDYGSPINYLEIFENNRQKYLFFKTNHHIGIHLLPIDGNPFRALGLRVSLTGIIDCALHPEGTYVFTISDYIDGISMWKVNIQAVDDYYKSGGEGLDPFLKMLGKEKEREIREFFDLSQFLHQGMSPNHVHSLNHSLPMCEVPDVLQALGCVLSKQDIAELTNEVLRSDPENPTFNIEYEDFVILYLNHRRNDDNNINTLREAFYTLYKATYLPTCESLENLQLADSTPVFDAATFMQIILASGEELTSEELFQDLSILTGGRPGDCPAEDMMLQVPPTMPKEISFDVFIKHILGFPVNEQP